MKWNLRLVVAAEGMLVLLAVVAALAGTQTVRGNKAALLIIDVQDCFLPGGSMAVEDGEKVIPVINKMREDFADRFSLVVLSQDWHCPDHVSFANQHPGAATFSAVDLTYTSNGTLCRGNSVPTNYSHAIDCSAEDRSGLLVVSQTLWPEHCIKDVTAGSISAAFAATLTVKETDIIIRKGDMCGIDSYSAFYDNGGFRQTALNSILKQHEISLVVVTGLALDYCVYYTSKDAFQLGYKVLTVTDASRGVDAGTTAAALKDMQSIGVELVEADDLEGALQDPSQATDRGGLSFFLLLVAGALITAYYLTVKA